MNQKLAVAALLAVIILFSCKKTANNQSGPYPSQTKIAPDGFNYTTTKQVAVNIQLLAPDNTPVAGVPVSFYASLAIGENGNPDENTSLFSGLSDKNGYVKSTIVLPAYIDTVLVDAKYTGIMRNAKAYISGGAINAVIGGKDGISGDIALNSFRPGRVNIGGSINNGVNGANGTTYVSMGSTDNSGRPTYLVSPPDVISNALISYVNASLPESQDVRKTHPQYLTTAATGDVVITQTADVWITFVSEGAGNLNSVGFYTFPTGTPPSKPSDITTVNIMYPNASQYGSGGTLRAGDKIKLGTFQGGTTVGFVLFGSGWAGTNTVNTSATKFYSDTKLNPETDPALQRHTVLLNDASDQLYLVGFEDILRSSPSCDHDFNDVVFYASSNPVAAISNSSVAVIDKPNDADGDGVTDIFDQYPTDPTRAYNTYYPSASSFSTLAFEDLWPATGDYDMNDLVVNYRYNFVTNAQNQVVELYGDYAVQAAGASFQNGFGVQFPFSASLVKKATGQKIISNYITLAGNGVESGQTNAVIIPFDNHQALINNIAGAYFINTKNEMPKVTGDTAHMYVQFTSPISLATLGTAPFNPFVISNLRRAYEVHLPGSAPTGLANIKLLGTGEDVSNAGTGIYYVSKGNWPWAISFPGSFKYPLEGANITNAYKHFLDWAGSGGTQYTDWFSNTSSGYRNTDSLYNK